ncbi:hypothetical protein ACLI4Y_02425 [Natrialbaceae archaeon A-CW3]
MALWHEIIRGSAILAIVGLTLLVPALLLEFGYTHERFLLLAILVLAAWAGGVAVVTGRTRLGYLAAGALFVFSLWDDLIQTAAVPTAVLIALGVLATRYGTKRGSRTSGSSESESENESKKSTQAE